VQRDAMNIRPSVAPFTAWLRRPAVRVLLVALCATAFVAGSVVGCDRSVDRQSYVAANVALLQHVPAFPGSRLTAVDSSGYKSGENAFAQTIGYFTTRTYVLPRTVAVPAVLAFYRRALARSWRLQQVYPWVAEMNFRRGNAYLEVIVQRRSLQIMVDQDCYHGSATSGCGGP
jgi:hypothetical protein